MSKKILFTTLVTIDIIALSICLFLRYLSFNTHTYPLYFPQLLIQALKKPTLPPNFNFIILGLDPRDDSLEKTKTTDTIILGNFSSNHNINLIPLPRDLWDYYLNTKINQIYPLSEDKSDPYAYIQQEFQHLTGQQIDRTLIFTTDNLIDLVNLIGGVDVYLDQAFTDNFYPNPDYINNPIPQIPKYITINFPQGKVTLDSTNITEFVRSRKSADTALLGGTDIARIQRQQLLIQAIFNQLKSVDYLRHPQTLFKLYNYIHQQLQTNFSDIDLIGIGLKNYRNLKNFSLYEHSLPSGEDPDTNLIYHPTTFINSQWVFIPQDKDYYRFQQYIRHSIQSTQ